MRIRVSTLLLPLPLLLAGLALAAPASANGAAHPCSCAADFPLASPLVCYEAPGARIADFAYVPGHFLQVVGYGAGGYCRHNGAFQWQDTAGVAACEAFVGCACGTPTFGEEICGNGIDDDCDGSVDTIAGERFEDRGATVFDCQTNLEWGKKTGTYVFPGDDCDTSGAPDCAGDPQDVNKRYRWSSDLSGPNGTAFTTFLPEVANALGGDACNHADWSCTDLDPSDAEDSLSCTAAPPDGCWRIPEIDELRTIVDPASGPPRIDPIFAPTAPSFYWSATSLNPGNAWFVNFDNEVVDFDGKDFVFHVRAVRSGP